jgi:Trypsin
MLKFFVLGSDPPAKTGTVVGWGRTSEGGVIPSHVMEVQVPILSLAACRKMQYRPARISSYMLCAGDANKDSCQVLIPLSYTMSCISRLSKNEAKSYVKIVFITFEYSLS